MRGTAAPWPRSRPCTARACRRTPPARRAAWGRIYAPLRTPRGSKPNSIVSIEQRRTHSFRPGPARSGSITEQVIDVNGVRKVVLQMTSSSSSGDEDSTSNDRTSPTSQRPSPSQERAEIIYEQAIESEHDGGSTNTSKKKRRRRKKKKQGNEDPENAPLLPK